MSGTTQSHHGTFNGRPKAFLIARNHINVAKLLSIAERQSPVLIAQLHCHE